jgi:AcrR family transcriptional regulator
MVEASERGAATRERLLDGARELFASRGYQHTSIQDLLTRTGISRGALYHHFVNKQQLFEAVLEQLEAEIAQTLVSASQGAESGRDALRAGCAAWFELTRDPAVRQIALIDAPTAVGWARWRAIDARHGFGLLQAALAGEARAGRLDPQLVDSYAHIVLVSLMELGLVIAGAEDPHGARDRAQRALDELLDRLLDG